MWLLFVLLLISCYLILHVYCLIHRNVFCKIFSQLTKSNTCSRHGLGMKSVVSYDKFFAKNQRIKKKIKKKKKKKWYIELITIVYFFMWFWYEFSEVSMKLLTFSWCIFCFHTEQCFLMYIPVVILTVERTT